MSELMPVEQEVQVKRKYRREIPAAHQISLDTRIVWLWNQRFGTIQMVYQYSSDYLDKTAATLYLQAIMTKDLASIQQILQRLEGGPLTDEDLLDQQDAEKPMPI